MITYQIGKRFFAMKSEAAEHAKAIGQHPTKITKLRVDDRDSLARLLTVICDPVEPRAEAEATLPVAAVDVPSFVPDFVRRDWEVRERFSKNRLNGGDA